MYDNEEKWIDDWINSNTDLISDIRDAVYQKDKEKFFEIIPHSVHGYYDYGDRIEPDKTYSYYDRPRLPLGTVLTTSFVTGGASGGNCWGDEAESFSSDCRPEGGFLTYFVSAILEGVTTNITVSDAMTLNIRIQKLVKQEEWSESEYYGNYNNILCYYVDREELYQFLERIIHA